MSEAHAPAAWWEEVEHLRESAERRIAERERAQREGREPVALPPLRPLRESERHATPPPSTPSPRPLQPAPPPARTGRFRRAGGGSAAAHAAAATATATALVLDDGPLQPWIADEADPLTDPAPPVAAPAPAAPARPAPARREEADPEPRERPNRREELSRLAREQARAATVARPRAAAAAAGPVRAGTPVAGRRTIEIRGRAEPRAVIAAVPDPVEPVVDTYRRRRPRPTAAERFAAQPDRVALWAFLLGLFLLLVALISAH